MRLQLFFLLIVLQFQSFLSNAQSLDQKEMFQKISLIKDSIDIYKVIGDDKKVLSICENGITLLNNNGYFDTPACCLFCLQAGESSLKIQNYIKAKLHFYNAFVIDNIGRHNVNAYDFILNEGEKYGEIAYFLDIINLAKSEPSFLVRLALKPDSLAKEIDNKAIVYFQNGDYSSAIDQFEMEISILDAIGNTGNNDYLEIMTCITKCLEKQQKTEQAISYASYYIDLTKAYKGENSKQYALALITKANIYLTFDKGKEAVEIFQNALSLIEKQKGRHNMLYIKTYRDMAFAYELRDGNILKKLELELEAETLLNQAHDATVSDKMYNLSSLSNLFAQKGDIASQLEYAEKNIKLLEKEGLTYNIQYASALSDISKALLANRIYKKAIELGEKSVDLYSKLYSSPYEKQLYYIALSNLSSCYFESGNYNKATSILEQFLSSNIPDDENRIICIQELIYDYKISGQKEKMKASCQELLNIAQKIYDKKSPLYAQALTFAFEAEEKRGDQIKMLREASEIYLTHYGQSSQRYLETQRLLNILERDVKNPEDANNEHNSIVNKLKSQYGENSRFFYDEYGFHLFHESNLAYDNHNVSALKEIFFETENILNDIEKVFGNKDDLYLKTESYLADMCVDIHKLSYDLTYMNKGINYQNDIVEKTKKFFGESDDRYINSLADLAQIKSNHYEYFEDAENIQRKVVDYYKINYGEKHKFYAYAIHTLGSLYLRDLKFSPFNLSGKVDIKFIDSLLLSQNMTQEVYDSKFQSAVDLENKALDYFRSIGDFQECFYILSNLHLLYEMNSETGKGASCYKESFEYWKSEKLTQFGMFTSDEKSKLVNSYDWHHQIEIFSFPAYRETIDFLQSKCHPLYSEIAYDAQLFNKGLLLNSEIGLRDLIKESNDHKSIVQYDRLQRIKDEIAKATSDSVKVSLRKEYNSIERSLMKESQQYGDYMKNLSLTFSDVQANMKSNDLCIEFVKDVAGDYYALILKKTFSSPKTIKICNEKDLKGMNYSYNYDEFWKPLIEELKGIKNVFFAPTMTLNNMPLESALMTDDGLFSKSGINLYRVSSTREIIKDKRRKKIDYAVLYGGLQYDADAKVLIASDKQERTNGLRGAIISLDDNISNDLQDRGHLWNYLKESKQEVSEIKQIASSYGIKTELYLDAAGTESTFKNLSKKGVNLLHVATHGSYINSKEGKSEEEQLERSYLALTGANNTERGVKLPEGVDDGILTAAEISRLDLRGLDLVVLSACESGLGDISTEGVYGLQRGFKKAGANTILMSLWNVDDYATKMLMVEFYKNFLKGDSKTTSLKKAQEYVKSQPGYEDPEFWAGFILLDGLD